MKATVKNEFFDNKTRILHTPKNEKTGVWTGTEERFKEINQKLKIRYKSETLEAIEEAAPVQKEAKPKTETKERKIKGETK